MPYIIPALEGLCLNGGIWGASVRFWAICSYLLYRPRPRSGLGIKRAPFLILGFTGPPYGGLLRVLVYTPHDLQATTSAGVASLRSRILRQGRLRVLGAFPPQL